MRKDSPAKKSCEFRCYAGEHSAVFSFPFLVSSFSEAQTLGNKVKSSMIFDHEILGNIDSGIKPFVS